MERKNEFLQIIEIANKRKEEGRRVRYEDIKDFLNNRIEYFTVPRKAYITTEHLNVPRLFYVLSGSFLTMRSSQRGTNNVLNLEKGPYLIGIDRAVLSGDFLLPAALAKEECRVVAIDRDYFLKSVREDNDLAFEIIKILSRKVGGISYRLDQILFYKTPEKLILYILRYWAQYHAGQERCVIDVKNNYISDSIGVSVRTLYRAINELKDRQLISTADGNIVVTCDQIRKMEEICDFFIYD